MRVGGKNRNREHAWSPCRKRQSSIQGHSLPACPLVLISDRVLTVERTVTDSETTNLPIHMFRTQSTWKANAIYKVQIYNWLDSTTGRVNDSLHGTGQERGQEASGTSNAQEKNQFFYKIYHSYMVWQNAYGLQLFVESSLCRIFSLVETEAKLVSFKISNIRNLKV